MIQVKSPITVEILSDIEDYLAEKELVQWVIMQSEPNGVLSLSGFFETKAECTKHWRVLRNFFSELPEQLEYHKVKDRDWKEAYKDHFKSWNKGKLHWVPEWERETYRVPTGDAAIYLDPGMAFGTSDHPSTRLCLMALCKYYELWGKSIKKKSIIDAGCGSGILALSAAKLGFETIYAFDKDPVAIRVSRKNRDNNSLEKALDFRQFDLETALIGKRGDLIFGNILSSILCRYAEVLLEALFPLGTLVLSGMQDQELNDTIEYFKKCASKLKIGCYFETVGLDNWSSITISRT